MGTTTKGLPYPAGTDPVTQGDDAIKALADALDFTKLQQLTVGAFTPATPLETYPLGLSVLSIGSADAPSWPSGTTSHLLTVKTNTARCAQFLFTNLGGANSTSSRVYYRQMQPTGGTGNTPWVLLSPWTGLFSLTDIAGGAAGTVAVTFPVSEFSAAPLVTATAQGSSFAFAGLSGAASAAGVTVYVRNTGTGVLSGLKVNVIAEGG